MDLMNKMETWLFIIIVIFFLCVAASLRYLYDFFFLKLNLPPGPTNIPLIGNVLLLRKSLLEFESVLRNLHTKYGPIVTVHFGSRPVVFISSHSLSHQALVQKGAVFSDRPEALPVTKILTNNQHNISTAFYGPTWRIFRRNLAAGILHPSRGRSYAHARKWVLEILLSKLGTGRSGNPVQVMDHFRYAMFCLLVLMCFGDKLEENQIREIERVQRKSLLRFRLVNMLNFCPRLRKYLLQNHSGEDALQLRKDREAIMIPLITARHRLKQQMGRKQEDSDGQYVLSYVDTLLDVLLPVEEDKEEEEKRKLSEGEMVSLCSEFLTSGTETTATALQWIMANLVKHPHIQAKLFEEISGAVGEGTEEVGEEDLGKLTYLKAVILEGLRRHPPTHFLLPHSVVEDAALEGFVIPKNTTVSFTVADVGWDPKIWEDPMAYKPERFLKEEDGNGVEGFDVSGRKEIKMIPFGAGRRICPGYELAILHLEYFVANLVLKFEWRAIDGDEVDLSEKQEFTVVMKNPLKAHLYPRLRSN